MGLLNVGSCQSGLNFADAVAEIQLKLSNERALSTGRPWTCEYVTLLQSFHRGTLGVHWYIAQNVYSTFSMFVSFSPSFKAAMFRRFLKVAIATSSIMNEVYNGGLALEFNVSVLKKTIALVGVYVSETWEKNPKKPGKYR